MRKQADFCLRDKPELERVALSKAARGLGKP